MRKGLPDPNTIGKIQYRLVMISVQELNESESGQIFVSKFKWTYFDYMTQNVESCINSMKRLKQPTSVILQCDVRGCENAKRKTLWVGEVGNIGVNPQSDVSTAKV